MDCRFPAWRASRPNVFPRAGELRTLYRTGLLAHRRFPGYCAMADERNQDPQMDAAALYREEMFTDRKVGAIRRLTPVTSSGAPDSTRPVLFIGQAEIM